LRQQFMGRVSISSISSSLLRIVKCHYTLDELCPKREHQSLSLAVEPVQLTF